MATEFALEFTLHRISPWPVSNPPIFFSRKLFTNSSNVNRFQNYKSGLEIVWRWSYPLWLESSSGLKKRLMRFVNSNGLWRGKHRVTKATLIRVPGQRSSMCYLMRRTVCSRQHFETWSKWPPCCRRNILMDFEKKEISLWVWLTISQHCLGNGLGPSKLHALFSDTYTSRS